MVTHFGRALDLKCAIASKFRPRAEEAMITEIIGDFSGKRTAIILDDMISSGGTVHALAERLVREKGVGEIYLGVSHNLGVGQARERLVEMHERFGLREAVVTDSSPATESFLSLPFVSVRCLAEIFARTINRIHYSRSVSEIFRRAEIG
jgi:ribose-phosphate pyrophosphokinase